jgi:hypothetical protein
VTIISQFWGFLKSPEESIRFNGSFSQKLKIFLILFGLEIVLAVIALLIVVLIYQLSDFLPRYLPPFLFFNRVPGAVITFLMVALFLPVVEELLFRFNLRLSQKFLFINVLTGIACLCIFLMIADDNIYYRIAILTLGISIAIFYFLKKAEIDPMITSFWSRRFSIVFYTTAILFAVAHIFKYPISLKLLLVTPLFVTPQFIMGLFTGFIRLRLGFGWGCFVHSLHNLIVALPFLVSGLIAKTQDYNFSMTEAEETSATDRIVIKNDSIRLDALSMDQIFIKLLRQQGTKLIFEDTLLAQKRYSVYFERDREDIKPTSLSSRQIVLNEILKNLDLKHVMKVRKQYYYSLSLIDTLLLETCKAVDQDTSQYFTDYPAADMLRLNNAYMWQVTRSLTGKYKVEFRNHVLTRNKYTLTIPDMKLPELNSYMLKNYGLRFDKVSEKTIVSYIRKR